jgi:hypothetical protein
MLESASPLLSRSPLDTHGFTRYAAAVVMQLAYGKYPKGFEDSAVQAVSRCVTRVGIHMRPGLWKVDVFPFLRFVCFATVLSFSISRCPRYIPGYLKVLQDGHKEELALFCGQLQELREKIVRAFYD